MKQTGKQPRTFPEIFKNPPPIIAAAIMNLDRDWTERVLGKLGIAIIVAGVNPDYSVFQWGEFGERMGTALRREGLGQLDSEDFLSAHPMYLYFFHVFQSRVAEALQLLSKEVESLKLSEHVALDAPIIDPAK